MDVGYQNHFCMELMGARVTPIDDGYDVIATTIWPAEAQSVVAQVLEIDANRYITFKMLGRTVMIWTL